MMHLMLLLFVCLFALQVYNDKSFIATHGLYEESW